MLSLELRETEQIAALARDLAAAPAEAERIKREAFAAAAQEMEQMVSTAIDQEIDDRRGRVQSWQAAHVGDRGGYAAVRPRRDTWTEASKRTGRRYAVGRVTGAIVQGHAFPRPSGRPGYRPRIRSGGQSVPPRPFYSRAAERLPELAQRTAQRVAEAIIAHFGG